MQLRLELPNAAISPREPDVTDVTSQEQLPLSFEAKKQRLCPAVALLSQVAQTVGQIQFLAT